MSVPPVSPLASTTYVCALGDVLYERSHNAQLTRDSGVKYDELGLIETADSDTGKNTVFIYLPYFLK